MIRVLPVNLLIAFNKMYIIKEGKDHANIRKDRGRRKSQ